MQLTGLCGVLPRWNFAINFVNSKQIIPSVTILVYLLLKNMTKYFCTMWFFIHSFFDVLTSHFDGLFNIKGKLLISKLKRYFTSDHFLGERFEKCKYDITIKA